MPRLTIEELSRRLDALADEAVTLADAIRPIEEVPGEEWVSADGIADDLVSLARDVRSDLVPPVAA